MGNLPILTAWTAEVTSQGPQGQDPASRIKMVKGFFLNRISMNGRDTIIDQGIKDTLSIDPCPADSLLPFWDDTPHRTDIAPGLLAWQRFV